MIPLASLARPGNHITRRLTSHRSTTPTKPIKVNITVFVMLYHCRFTHYFLGSDYFRPYDWHFHITFRRPPLTIPGVSLKPSTTRKSIWLFSVLTGPDIVSWSASFQISATRLSGFSNTLEPPRQIGDTQTGGSRVNFRTLTTILRLDLVED